MSDAERRSVPYVVEYVDGPLAGETERRVLIGGHYDDRLGAVAAVEGLESLFWYNAGETREIQGELHVRYTFDAPHSDSSESDRDDD
ncbi:MAG: hypothetical protein QOH55_2162 [Microbacteriaceae bacterium]|jgi:hypothetical protein|nr:hypothetical protein [Microbacteriaceae bacterium]